MDKSEFEAIKIGVCSYFLILYSCMQLMEKLWYSSANGNLTEYLIPYIVPVLMLSGGYYLFKLYKKKMTAVSNGENPFVSAAVKFIGGWIILTLVLKYIISICLISMISVQINLMAFLFLLIYHGPFLLASAVSIQKGLRMKEKAFPWEWIAFLSLRTVLIFICTLSVRLILVQTIPIAAHDFSPILIKSIVLESVFAAASLTLLFAPLKLTANLKSAEDRSYADLSRRSFTLTGYLILIAGIPYIYNIVIRQYDSFFFLFFDLKEFLGQLIPEVFLILAGLFFIYCGRKKERMES